MSLLGGITICIFLCSKYSWTWDFSPAREQFYRDQFALVSAFLYCAIGTLITFHILTVLKTPMISQPITPVAV
ncbi:hypothetical protein [Candidatus Lokiarchaeum ossiferum]|uniref:hypothetical protein n=1 Tax=Candidatus Lokiarchaeum ossiferum TaxID=2951803 RepID=UPI00352C1459